MTRIELRDKLELIISYDEAEWLANTLWLSFVNKIKFIIPGFTGDESNVDPARLLQNLDSCVSIEVIAEHISLLE